MVESIPTNILISRIYEASSSPEKWQEVLGLLAQKIKADSASLIFRDFENPEADVSFDVRSMHSNQSPAEYAQMLAEYERHFHRIDPMWNLAAEHAKIGIAISDNQLGLSRAEYEALCPEDYLENFMRRYDRWYVGGSYIFQDEDKALVMAVQRGMNSTAWTDDEMQYLSDLSIHFQGAFNLHREFVGLRGSNYYLQSCINRMLIGVVILKPNGKIEFINELAQQIIDSNPVLSSHNDQLRANPAHNDNQLQALLDTCITGSGRELTQHTADGVAALALRLDESSAPLPMMITPLYQQSNTEQLAIGQPPSRIAIFFAEPERAHDYSLDAIAKLYDLTPAEAGVAIAISNGYTVAEYADRKNVKKSTVQTQVKRVAEKLEVSRQAEIVKVLLQTPNITPPEN